MSKTNTEHYDELGFVKYPSFLTESYINELNTILDNLDVKVSETVFDEDGTGKIKQIQYLYTRGELFRDLLSKVKEIGKELLQTKEFETLNMQLFEKHPHISKPTRSHQDNAYFKMEPASPITIWIALDDIDEENGCLYYAPKTHLTPTRKHKRYHPHTTFRTRS